jgi:hypothetical protein
MKWEQICNFLFWGSLTREQKQSHPRGAVTCNSTANGIPLAAASQAHILQCKITAFSCSVRFVSLCSPRSLKIKSQKIICAVTPCFIFYLIFYFIRKMLTTNTNEHPQERNEAEAPQGEHVQQPLEQEWDDLIVAPDDYQINRRTHVIRNKHTGISPTINENRHTGYFQFTINSATHPLHRILALQYVHNPSPERFTVVDHIDRNKKNNDLSNLRWVEPAFNSKNCLSHINQAYEWLDMLPEDLVQIQSYGKHHFDNLFYAQGHFYIQVGLQYRRLKVKTRSRLSVQNDQGENIAVYLSKLKRDYHLPN